MVFWPAESVSSSCEFDQLTSQIMKIFNIFSYLGIFYAIILITAVSIQRNLIFYPGKLAQDYKFNIKSNVEEIFLTTVDGERINALFFLGKKPEVILYFHGNAGDLSGWQFVSEDFTAMDYSFLIIDYRGYGKSSGIITEQGLYLDAEAAFRFLIEQKGFLARQILVYGRSIGSGVAVDLASKKEIKGLVLEAPYVSLKKLANEKAPWLLPSLWLRFHFNNMEKINHVRCPIIFIHGSDDTLIPPSHSKKLFEVFLGKKKIVILENGTHNDLGSFEEYHKSMRSLLNEFFN